MKTLNIFKSACGCDGSASAGWQTRHPGFCSSLLLFAGIAIALLFASTKSFAIDKYWIGPAGNFSDNTKWSLSSGGPNNTTFPGFLGSVDVAIFDGAIGITDGNTGCIITASIVVDGLLITGTYSAIISRGGGGPPKTITIGSSGLSILSAGSFDITNGLGNFQCTSLTQTNGIFSAGKSLNTFSGAVSISGGIFNCPSVGGPPPVAFQSTFTQTGGTFNGGIRNIVISGNFSLGGSAVFNAPAPSDPLLLPLLQFQSTFTQNGGTFNGGTRDIVIGNNFSLSGSAVFNAPSDAILLPTLQIQSAYTQTGGSFFAGAGNIVISGNFSLSGSSVFNAPAPSDPLLLPILQFQSAFTQTGGTFNGGTRDIVVAADFSLSGSAVFNSTTAQLQIKSNFNNSAAFNHNNGTVMFNGAASQTISGSSPTTTFNHLTVNTGGATTVSVLSSIKILGVLDIFTGQFVTGDKVTLISNISRTAAIGDLTNAIASGTSPISGKITIERFVVGRSPTGGPGWKGLASPVIDAAFTDWKQDFYMTGFPGSHLPSYPFKSVITWNEPPPLGERFVPPANVFDQIDNATGWFCYMGNDGIGSNMPKTLTLSGTPQTGTVTVPGLTNTLGRQATESLGGWNFLGNPYASPIDWREVAINPGTTNINACAVWLVVGTGSYLALPAFSIKPELIASGQAFWVFVPPGIGNGAVQIEEDDKLPLSPDIFNQNDPPLTFQIILHRGTYKDTPSQLFFANSLLNSPTSRGLDPLLEAAKRTNIHGFENLATVVGENNLSVNCIPDSITELTIPIRVWEVSPRNINKTYTLEFKDIARVQSANKCVSFEDVVTGVNFVLTNDTSYTVTMRDTTYVPRFFIHISGVNVTIDGPATICKGSSVTLTAGSCSGCSYLWSTGETSQSITVSPSSTTSYTVTVTNAKNCSAISDSITITVNPPCGNNKVFVCHIPLGNPANLQTICVSENSIPAHIAHGDYCGPCNTISARKAGNSDSEETDNNEIIKDMKFAIYPNPFNREVTFFLQSETNEIGLLRISDLTGRTIYESNEMRTNEPFTAELNLQAGIYFAEINIGASKNIIKLIKTE